MALILSATLYKCTHICRLLHFIFPWLGLSLARNYLSSLDIVVAEISPSIASVSRSIKEVKISMRCKNMEFYRIFFLFSEKELHIT